MKNQLYNYELPLGDFIGKKVLRPFIPLVVFTVISVIDYYFRYLDNIEVDTRYYFLFLGVPFIIAFFKAVGNIIDRSELCYRANHNPDYVKPASNKEMIENVDYTPKSYDNEKYENEKLQQNPVVLNYMYQRAKKRIKGIVAVFLIIDLIAAVYIGGYFWKLAHYHRVEGAVFDVSASTVELDDSSSTTYSFNVQYEYEGNKYTIHGSSDNYVMSGQGIAVYFDPESPGDAFVADNVNFGNKLLFLLLLHVIPGLAVYDFKYHKQRKDYADENARLGIKRDIT